MNLLMLILVFLGIAVSFSIAYFFWRLVPKIQDLELNESKVINKDRPEKD
jgi:hypothetical protein